MKKFVSVLIILLSYNNIVWAILPVVNVPDLPRNLRNYITDESKYFELLVDNYLRAKLLAWQLGIPDTVSEISYIMVQNQDLRELRRYNDLAKFLYRRVLDLKDDSRILNLRNNLENLSNDLKNARAENDSLRMLLVEGEICQKTKKFMDSTIKSLTLRLEECEESWYNEFFRILKQSKFSPLLGGNIKAQQWFFDNPRLTTPLSPSFDLELHLFSMAQDVIGVKFSSSYHYLTNVVDFPETTFPLKETYRDDIWNFSAIFFVNLSKIIDSKSLYWEIDLSGGYFRGFTKSNSPINFQNDYKGYSFGAYTLLGGFSQRIPIGVLAGATFYKFIDEFGFDGLKLGKPFVPSAFVGLRFNILNTF